MKEGIMYRMGVLESSTCHYCGEKAMTEDHIVPRALLPKPMSLVPYWFRSMNVLPACHKCNGEKAHFRSDCTCDWCMWAWHVAKAVFIPMVKPDFVYDEYPIRHVVRSPG